MQMQGPKKRKVAESADADEEVESADGIVAETKQALASLLALTDAAHAMIREARICEDKACALNRQKEDECAAFCGHVFESLPREPHEHTWYRCVACNHLTQLANPPIRAACSGVIANARRVEIRRLHNATN